MSQLDFTVLEPGIGQVTLNRPEKRNAINAEMRRGLVATLLSNEVQALRVLILRGEGVSFCAGVDLSEVGRSEPADEQAGAGTQLFNAFRSCAPVIIAAVQGYALGLGSGIAVACDLVVASDAAEFGYPEIVHDLVAAITMMGLRDLVGPRRAMELLVTGRRVSAAEALDLGLITEVVAGDDLNGRTRELAREVASHSMVALHATKRLFYETSGLPYTEAIQAGEDMVRVARATAGAQAKASAYVKAER